MRWILNETTTGRLKSWFGPVQLHDVNLCYSVSAEDQALDWKLLKQEGSEVVCRPGDTSTRNRVGLCCSFYSNVLEFKSEQRICSYYSARESLLIRYLHVWLVIWFPKVSVLTQWPALLCFVRSLYRCGKVLHLVDFLFLCCCSVSGWAWL